MKSIMEEASSVAKAIEKGWQRAGKPQEFTVKIFEEAQKNFIGMTTKPAKIGLFFEETSRVISHKYGKKTPERSFEKHSAKPQEFNQRHFVDKTKHHERPERTKNQPQERQHNRPPAERTQDRIQQNVKTEHQQQLSQRNQTSPWSPELVDSAQEWIKNSLGIIGQGNLAFSAEVERYALRVTFPKLITHDNEKEKMLFRSWAYLIMQSLRQKYKRPLKGLKVILMSNA